MQEPHVIGGFLFPTNQQASRSVGPRVGSFHDPATCPTAAALRNRRAFTLAGNVNGVLATTYCMSHRFRIISLVRAEMLLSSSRRLGTPHRDVLKRFSDQLLVMYIGSGHGYSNGHTAPVCQHRSLDAQLAAIGRVFPGFFPLPVAPLVIAPSKLCHRQSIPFNSSYSSRARCHSFSNMPRCTHS